MRAEGTAGAESPRKKAIQASTPAEQNNGPNRNQHMNMQYTTYLYIQYTD